MILGRIAFLLDDLFGIPHYMVEKADHLEQDWGIDSKERSRFNSEFCAEFEIKRVPAGVNTVEEYMELVSQ